MFDGIDISKLCVLARQGQSESDLCTSMSYMNSMLDGIDISRLFVIARQGASDNDFCISMS